MRGVDAVVHLAVLTGARESVNHPARYYRLNVGGTATLLEALVSTSAAGRHTPRFLLASTGTVYGAPKRQPISEDVPPAPRNPYSATKATAEQLLAWTASAGSIAAASLRIFNAAGGIGEHVDPHESGLIPCALAAAYGQVAHLDVYGDGSAVRDYVHIADVGNAFATVLRACEPGRHDIFNVGATPASVRSVIDAVSRVTGRTVPLVRHPPNGAESPELRADTTRLRALGWRPVHSGLAPWCATRNPLDAGSYDGVMAPGGLLLFG